MKPSRSAIHRQTYALPTLRFEDQQLTSFSGLVIFQRLFEHLRLKNHVRDCFRHLRVKPIFGHASIIMLLIVHMLLGYRELRHLRYGSLGIARKSQLRMRKRVRELTYRNRGRSLAVVMRELTRYLRGWLQYFRLARARSLLRDLDAWIRRRLRCYRLKQRKRRWPIAQWLQQLGVKEHRAWQLAMSSKGWWRLSRNPVIHQALPNPWFEKQGLFSLLKSYDQLSV